MATERDSLSDRRTSRAVVYIARCPEHGLHGERDECFVCSGPVEHVVYVRGEQFTRVQSERDRLRTAARKLVSAYMAGEDLGPAVARLEGLTGGQQG